MAQVEIAIRSIFQDDGVVGAEAGLSKIITKLDQMDAAFAESNQQMDNFVSRQSLLDSGVFDLWVRSAREVIPAVKELEEQFQRLTEVAIAAQASGRPDLAITLAREAQQVEQTRQAHLKLVATVSQEGVALKKLTQFDFRNFVQGARNATELTEKIRHLKSQLKTTATEAAKMGDVNKLIVTSESISNLTRFIDTLKNLEGISDTTRQKLGGLGDELKELSRSHRESQNTGGMFLKTLNRLGFSLFILQSSIRTVIGLFESFINVFKEGAEQASLFLAFSKSIRSTGADVELLRRSLEATSRGLLDTNKMMEATLRLMKAGVPDFEKTAATMAGLAVNAAKVSGELGNVDEIFEKLIKGIVRGSPRLIDDTDVVLKLGDAYAVYAESIGKAADELSEKEQQRAVVAALEEESLRMEELSEAVGDLPSEPFKILTNQAKDFGRALSSVAGQIGGDIAGGIVNALGLVSREFDSVADAMKAAEEEAARMNVIIDRAAEGVQAMEEGTIVTEGGFTNVRDRLAEIIRNMSLADKISASFRITWENIKALTKSAAGFISVVVELVKGALAAWAAFDINMRRTLEETLLPIGEALDALFHGRFGEYQRIAGEVWDNLKEGTGDALAAAGQQF